MTARVMRYTVIVRDPETDIPKAVLAGLPVPAWAKDLVHDEDLVADDAGPGTEPEPETNAAPLVADDATQSDTDNEADQAPAETPDYSSWKNADLEAEIERRNQGRDADTEIEVEGAGNKADLVAALVADDATQSDTDN